MKSVTTHVAGFGAVDTSDELCVITTLMPLDQPTLEDDVTGSSNKLITGDNMRAHSKRVMSARQKVALSGSRNPSDKDGSAVVPRRRLATTNDPSPIGLINQELVQFQQMTTNFYDTYFSPKYAKTHASTRSPFWDNLVQLDTYKLPLMRHAVAAVCMADIGNRSNDVRLRVAAHKQYAAVVRCLQREITLSAHKSPPWVTMFCILLLALVDAVSSHNNTQHTEWVTHYEGAFAYLRAFGPSQFNISNPMKAPLVLQLTSEPAMYIGLARRKSSLFGQSEWVQHVSDSMRTPNSSSKQAPPKPPLKGAGLPPPAACWDFRTETYKVPAILERVEGAITSPSGDRELANICIEVEQLIKESRQASSKAGLLAEKMSDNLVHLSEHEKFDPLREEHVFITSNPTFQSFFPSENRYRVIRLAGIMKHELILNCVLLRIYHFHPQLAVRDGYDARPQIHHDAFSHASNLCRTIYCVTHDAHSQAMTSTADLFILLAQNYFENAGCVRELGWCQGARLAIRLHLNRLLAQQPRTLCRIGDLVESVGSVTAFRSLTQTKLCPCAG